MSQSASAAMPVIDIGAIAQLVSQLKTLESQLVTLRGSLTQAQQSYQAITGRRGMEALLSGTVRNYLPSDWQQMASVWQDASNEYRALAQSIKSLADRNAVLTPAELARFSPASQARLLEDRRSVATVQALAQQALSASSARFASLQQLIRAIPTATDEKAVLDLQARIAAEQGMLENEQTKVQLILKAADAENAAREARHREQELADLGSLRSLPPMGL